MVDWGRDPVVRVLADAGVGSLQNIAKVQIGLRAGEVLGGDRDGIRCGNGYWSFC